MSVSGCALPTTYIRESPFVFLQLGSLVGAWPGPNVVPGSVHEDYAFHFGVALGGGGTEKGRGHQS